MKRLTIESSYHIRDNKHSTYHSFTEYSDNIEKQLVSHLNFLEGLNKPYTLNFTLKKD